MVWDLKTGEEIIYPQDGWGWKITNKYYADTHKDTLVVYEYGKKVAEAEGKNRMIIKHLIFMLNQEKSKNMPLTATTSAERR